MLFLQPLVGSLHCYLPHLEAVSSVRNPLWVFDIYYIYVNFGDTSPYWPRTSQDDNRRSHAVLHIAVDLAQCCLTGNVWDSKWIVEACCLLYCLNPLYLLVCNRTSIASITGRSIPYSCGQYRSFTVLIQYSVQIKLEEMNVPCFLPASDLDGVVHLKCIFEWSILKPLRSSLSFTGLRKWVIVFDGDVYRQSSFWT
jgi:hypothetical protein